MVRQYPYSLFVATHPVAAKDSDGNYSAPGLVVWAETSPCRDEGPDKGQLVTLEDGTAVLFSAIVYLPLSAPDVAVGTGVEVRKAGVGRRVWGRVKRFDRGQLHCTLWV